MCEVSDEVLTKSIREILVSADLNVMTSKLVRNELKTRLNIDHLDDRKQQINAIIADVIQELSQACEESDKEADKSSDDSSSSDDDKDVSDETLARNLHKQELDSSLRSTRNARKAAPNRKTKDKKVNDEDKTTKKRKTGQNGFTKPCPLSTDLADFFGQSEMARHEVVKRIWSYVKENNLQDPKNKQFAICDNQLYKIMGRKRFRMFGMMKILAKHLNG